MRQDKMLDFCVGFLFIWWFASFIMFIEVIDTGWVGPHFFIPALNRHKYHMHNKISSGTVEISLRCKSHETERHYMQIIISLMRQILSIARVFAFISHWISHLFDRRHALFHVLHSFLSSYHFRQLPHSNVKSKTVLFLTLSLAVDDFPFLFVGSIFFSFESCQKYFWPHEMVKKIVYFILVPLTLRYYCPNRLFSSRLIHFSMNERGALWPQPYIHIIFFYAWNMLLSF